jgi:redox-sensitive bicupin YhaK (pirin superfamily)
VYKRQIQPSTPIEYHHYQLFANGALEIAVQPAHHSFLYPLSGEFQLGDEPDAPVFERGYLPMLAQDGDAIRVKNPSSTDTAEFIFLSGKPLGEPVARYGPFVMNSEMELQRAFYEYQSGQMGALEE